jgi:L-glyceraldehyde 3-phosphate reductase
MDAYTPAADRYATMTYQRCGASGLRLPALAFGMWHGFGELDAFARQRALVRKAFDLGITHFDLANTYGPPFGAGEETFARILKADLAAHRDELIIATKAGHRRPETPASPYQWDGSRKTLLASLDQSLRRLGLDYVDIFYLHQPDAETPLEESMGALSQAVRQGKALYVGIDRQPPEQARAAARILRELGTPCLIGLEGYSLFTRGPEAGLLPTLHEEGIGFMAFSPLFQGLLTDKYLGAVPEDSRMARPRGYGGTLDAKWLWPEAMDQLRGLNAIAQRRGQTLAQMAIAWVLRDPRVTAAVIGASRPEQLDANVGALRNRAFSAEELAAIDEALHAPERARAAARAQAAPTRASPSASR